MPSEKLQNCPKALLQECAVKLKGRWTRGAFAKDAIGRSIAIESKAAVKFCAVGILIRVGTESSYKYSVVSKARLRVERLIHSTLMEWNDETAKSETEVIEMFQKAVEEE